MADENNLEINIGINPSQAEAGARKTVSAVGSVVNESKQLDAAFRRLKSAIDPTFAATEKYNQALAEYDQLLKKGTVDQATYAKGIELVKKAYDSQIASIQKNSSVAKQADLEKKQAILAEVKAREASAAQQRQIAAAWLAQEKRNTAALRQELEQRKTAEKAYILEAVTVAKQAAAAQAAAMRQGGTTVTKTAETSMIRDAAAAAKQAARERFTAEHQADQEIVASYRQTYATAKALVEEAAASAVAAAQQRKTAETAIIEAQAAVEKAVRREEIQAAREASAVATAAAKDRVNAERQATAATRETARASEEAARAAKREADAVAEIRASINPTFAAQQRYNDTMQKATSLLMANKLQEGEWIAIQKQAKTQMDINVRSMGRMNAMSVQIGYQMQDVVASWASGINPLVILAQQGGQTASALSGLGGTAGRVAAFFAGHWGAAILGAITVLGFLWTANDKGEKKTNDVRDAEFRRTATVRELTAALWDYIKAAREKNNVDSENQRLTHVALLDAQTKATKALADANADLAQKKKALQDLESRGGSGEAYWSQLSGAQAQVRGAEAQVARARQAVVVANTAVAESNIEIAKSTASKTAEDQKYEQEQQNIIENYRLQAAILSQKGLPIEEASLQLQKDLTAARERHEARIKAEADAHRDNTNAMKQENAQYLMPVNGRITSGFGARSAPVKADGTRGSTNHMGIDIGVPVGTAVRAPQVGTVESVGYSPTMGKYVILNHGAGVTTRYLHLSDTSGLEKGQRIEQGQVFAKSGDTGGVKPHLHYEVRINGKPVDPRKGVFPIDTLKAEAQGMKDLETAAQKAAKEAVAAIDLQETALSQDDSLSMDQKLEKVRSFEASRVAIIEAAYGKQSKEAEDAKRHELETVDRYNKMILSREVQRLHQEEQIAQTRARAVQDAESSQMGNKSANVDFMQQNGLINDRQALSMKAQILQEEYAMQQAHEQAMWQMKLSYLNQELSLPGQSADRKAEINAEIRAAEADHLAQMTQMQTGYAQRVADVNRQAAQQTLQQWASITNTFTSGMSSTFQGLWTHSQSLQEGLINLADQMVYKVVDMAIQAAGQQMMVWLGMKTAKKAMDAGELVQEQAHQAAKTAVVAGGEAARTGVVATAEATKQTVTTATTAAAVAAEGIKTGAAVTGAATQTGVAAAAGTTEIGTSAAVAAAGAYKSTVVIPFIGPIAAPAAAALALAAVLGFGALISAKGGMDEVPGDQLAMVHKKEMILPAWIAEPMRQQLKAGSSGGMFGAASMAGASARSEVNNNSGGNVNFNYQPTHNNQDTDLEALLRRDGQSLRKWIKNEHRNGNLKMGGKR